MVVELLDDQPLPEAVPGQDRPARALQARRGGSEVCAEAVEGPEVLLDGRTELQVRPVAAVGRHVRPEHRVADVPGEVEREVLLIEVHRRERVVGPRVGELFERGVGARHVALVVLGVVQLHDLAGDVRLERAVVVGQVRKRVVAHVHSFIAARSGEDVGRAIRG